MLSPIRRQCLLALFCLRGWAMRASLEEAATIAAAAEAADGGAEAAAAAAGKHAVEHAERVNPDGAFFVFVEVYQLLGGGLSKGSAAISGFDIADDLLQVAENASGARRGPVPPRRPEAAAGGGAAGGLLQAGENSVPLYHSEITVCPREGFLPEQVFFLASLARGMRSYEEIQRQDWARMQVWCEGVSWGSDGIKHYRKPLSQPMSGIQNADLSKVWKYFYGTGNLPVAQMLQKVAGGPCDGYWRPDCYHPVFQNCNYFVNVAMSCGFALSASMPNLHLSGLKKVMFCQCRGEPRAWC